MPIHDLRQDRALGIEATCLEALVDATAASRRASAEAPLKALLVDSWYDAYLGVDRCLVRVMDGALRKRA